MSRISSYSKIYNLGHREAKEIFSDSVCVEEKVDGSQFSFGVYGGELVIRSRGGSINPDAPAKMFAPAVEKVRAVAADLRDGYTYRGEAVCRPKHNSLCYDRTPNGFVAIFDIDRGNQDYLGWQEKILEATRLGFECVPLLGVWEPGWATPERVAALLETKSFLGGQYIEGFVIKNYSRYDRGAKTLMAKYVSERFKEVHRRDWKDRNPGQNDILTTIGQRYKTEARWEKAVQHLAERGELTDSPRDIGALLKEVNADVLEECADDIKADLLKWAWKIVAKQITSGLPEWYKQRLVSKQFEATAPKPAGEGAD